ncbi:MAG: hypothetical protein IKQ93_08045 [Candidatus Methanomethylophilaceae archaeon]|nr:hypothetical protein [Candidatus Methanomethylophilaceae archaeon]
MHEDGEGDRSCRGDASMVLCGGRTVIMYKCDRMMGSIGFQDETNRMLGVNAVVMNLTGLKTPLEGRTIYGSEPDRDSE